MAFKTDEVKLVEDLTHYLLFCIYQCDMEYICYHKQQNVLKTDKFISV